MIRRNNWAQVCKLLYKVEDSYLWKKGRKNMRQKCTSGEEPGLQEKLWWCAMKIHRSETMNVLLL